MTGSLTLALYAKRRSQLKAMPNERNFASVLKSVRGPEWIPPHRLLCLDPGGTTGWALFVDGILTDAGQVVTIVADKVQYAAMQQLLEDTNPTHVVYENYRVYAHKLKQHTGSEVLTVRVIGKIESYVDEHQLVQMHQMAHLAKGFATDAKLKSWDMWQIGKRHSRDAVRHGIYALIFSKEL